MVLRLLMWLVLLIAAWWFVRPRPKPAPPSGAAGAAGAPPPAREALPLEAMLECAHCGLHLPASQALPDGAARVYCSPEHRRAGPHGGR